jgi:membrane protease YdiL (CAAX protease family)
MNTLKILLTKHPVWMTLIPSILLVLININVLKYLKIDSFYRPHSFFILVSIYVILIYKLVPKEILFVNWVNKKNWNFFLFPIIFLITELAIIAFIDKVYLIDPKFFVKYLFVGINEEFLFRSVCFGLLIQLYKQKNIKNPIYRAGIVSSFAFGIIHSINIVNDPLSLSLWFATAFQLLYSFLIGIGMVGFTYKTNSIIVPIIVHALIDLFGEPELFKQLNPNGVYYPPGVVQVLFLIPFIIQGYIYLKQSTKKMNF